MDAIRVTEGRIGSLRLHTIGSSLGKWINENLVNIDYKLGGLKSYHNDSIKCSHIAGPIIKAS